MKLVLVCILTIAVGIRADLEVFRIAGATGRYTIESAEKANLLCESYNGKLATLAQLEEAQKNGLDQCNCGWLVDGVVAFPLQVPRPGCGDAAGIRYCPSKPQAWGNPGWDAFCVRDQLPQCNNEFSFGLPLAKYTIRQTDWAQVFSSIQFPADGKVVGWNYYSMRPDVQAYAAVWRETFSEGSVVLRLVGRSRLPLGRVGNVKYFVDVGRQIYVKKGDVLGIHYDSVIGWDNNMDAVIPMAQGPKNLCADDGTCVNKSQLSNTWVFHRHDQQIAYKRDVRINIKDVKEVLVKSRAPALRPIFCANNAGDLPKQATTTTTVAPVTKAVITTPSEVEASTPGPEISDAPQTTETEPTEPETEEPETDGPSTTEKEVPPPTTTSTTTTTTTTTEAPTTTTAPHTTPKAAVVTEAGPEVAEAAAKDVPCHFPFIYRKQMVYACTSVASDKPWCSTEEVYDGTHWRYCHDGDLRIEDMPCHFPFNYKGSEYSSCITAFSDRPWCSVVEDYSPHAWKYCTDEDGSVGTSSCHLPFEYQGKSYNMCIKRGSPNFWCATAPKYGPYSWRNCEAGDPIPASMPCHFPFKFENKDVSTCIDKGAKKPWCAVEENYNGENWRYCREGDKFPEEKPCHFPFEYNGKKIHSCISENANRPWCSVIPVYNYHKDWRYCRNVDLFPLHGTKVKTVEEGQAKCQEQGMILAMEREALAAYEIGTESCQCGLVSNGKAIRLVHDPRKDCNEGGQKGLSVCSASADGFIPFCVLE